MVDSTTTFLIRQETPMVVSGIATMDQNATKTLAIPSHGRSVVRLGVPTIDSSTITFEVQAFPTGKDQNGAVITSEFRALKDDAGNTVTVTASTGGFEVDIPELAGAYAFKIVTAAQTSGAVLFEVQCVGPYPAPAGSNKLTVEGGSLTANQGTQASSATGSTWFNQGAGAAGSALTGFPFLLAGSDNTNAQYLRAGVSLSGSAVTGVLNGISSFQRSNGTVDNAGSVSSFSDSNGGNGYGAVAPMLSDGAATPAFARQRANIAVTLAASSARTTTLTVADQTNYNGAMLHAVIVVSAYTSGGLTPVINGKGNLNTYYALLTGAKISSTGTTVLKIGPGFATAVNQAAADMLPRTWNMVVTPDDATSITYSIEGNINE